MSSGNCSFLSKSVRKRGLHRSKCFCQKGVNRSFCEELQRWLYKKVNTLLLSIYLLRRDQVRLFASISHFTLSCGTLLACPWNKSSRVKKLFTFFPTITLFFLHSWLTVGPAGLVGHSGVLSLLLVFFVHFSSRTQSKRPNKVNRAVRVWELQHHVRFISTAWRLHLFEQQRRGKDTAEWTLS